MSSKTFNILFVCSGNSCRSPIAEGLMRSKLPEEWREKVTVKSAGTMGLFGNPATDLAIEVAEAFGADISSHRSQGVTEELTKDSDIIFVMSPEHQAYFHQRYPQYRENIFLLKLFGRTTGDIADYSIEDPIGGSRSVYMKCAEIIDSELGRILPVLKVLFKDKARRQ